MSDQAQHRQPRGAPSGGQFSTVARTEPAVELADQPTRTVDDDGTERWLLDGVLHRVDGPAAVWPDGRQEWRVNGLLHRVDGPAITFSDGAETWYRRGRPHRVDGPARTWPDGTEEWWVDGERTDPPDA